MFIIIFEIKKIMETKVCFTCKKELSSDCFTSNKATKSGLASNCRECYSQQRKIYNESNNYEIYHRYEKTKPGFLMRLYRNMKSRIDGVQAAKFHLYEGKALLPKDEFYHWANSDNKFHELYDSYLKSGYSRKIAPSVDRIDSSKGYAIDNMEWVTMSENSRRGSLNRKIK